MIIQGTRRMKASPSLVALVALGLSVEAGADVLCADKHGKVVIRAQCIKGEVVVDPGTLSPPSGRTIEARVAALEALVASASLEDGGTTLRFTGVNVQVVSGAGSTSGDLNGLGNLIVGYNENPFFKRRHGSHNLVVGSNHGWTSYGGFVAGFSNRVSGPSASVCGGVGNTASGDSASVSGGARNDASGFAASVSGGFGNLAAGDDASVSGGSDNVASGPRASVAGGQSNEASGPSASVSGGFDNVASGLRASVAGGASRTLGGTDSYGPPVAWGSICEGSRFSGSSNWTSVGDERNVLLSIANESCELGPRPPYTMLVTGGYSMIGCHQRFGQDAEFWVQVREDSSPKCFDFVLLKN